MLGWIKYALSKVLRLVRRILLGRLATPEPIFESLSKIEIAVDELRRDVANIEKPDRTGAAPHGDMPENNLIDQQIEMAKYYMKTAMGDIAPGFSPIYERCKSYTSASVEQLYAIHSAIEYIVLADIPGDIVDCGAGRGGTTMVAALTLGALNALDRRIVVLDSYDLKPPGGESPAIRAADVSKLLESSGYPLDLVSLTPGMLEISTAGLPAGRIAFLRLDTNNYGSTTTALTALYPRIADGGVLLTTDVGVLAGPRQATIDFLAEQKAGLMLTRVDYSTRMAVKAARASAN